MSSNTIDYIRLKVIKEKTYKLNKSITKASDAYYIIQDFIGSADREYFLVIMLNIKNIPTQIQTLAIGNLNTITLNPREIFKGAIVSNANSIILIHNHPSGDYHPSNDDIETTKKMITVGKFLEIPVIDHVIFTEDSYFSFYEHQTVSF